MIAENLYSFEVAAPALVLGCQHWLVVSGVQTDVPIVEGVPYRIEGFWYHDPARDLDKDNGETHSSYADWLKSFFTGCASFRKPFVIVCDVRPPAQGLLLPERSPAPPSLAGGRFVDPQDAVQAALSGLERYEIANEDSHTPVRAPLLVQRTDRIDEFYYLVPLLRNDGTSTLVRIDARNAVYLGAELRGPTFPYVTPAQMLERFQLEERTLEFVDRSVRFWSGASVAHPTLIWQPCGQTMSPYAPLYQISVGGELLYVDGNNQVYAELIL